MPAATRLLFLTGWGVATGLLFWTPLAGLFGLSEEARRLGRVLDLVRPTGFFLTGCSDDLGFSNRPRLSANIDLNADCNIKGMQHSTFFGWHSSRTEVDVIVSFDGHGSSYIITLKYVNLKNLEVFTDLECIFRSARHVRTARCRDRLT